MRGANENTDLRVWYQMKYQYEKMLDPYNMWWFRHDGPGIGGSATRGIKHEIREVRVM